jgi:hypothetical protein
MSSTSPPLLRVRTDSIVWREVEGEIIALDLESSAYFAVNGAGVLLWHSLLEGLSRDALVELLVDGYAIDRARADTDVGAFLAQLDSRNWLEESAVTPGDGR